MKLQHIKAVLLGLIFCAANASATLITLETRDINEDFDRQDLLSSWEQSTAGVVNSIDSFDMFKSGRNSLTMLTIYFNINHNAVWSFEGGLDAGYGAAFFVDGELVDNRTDDLWWRYNWNHSDVFTIEDIAFTKGNHTVQLLWAEGCCNGASSARFIENSAPVKKLNVANIQAASIPEPTSLALFGLAILGLVTRRNLSK